MMKHIGAEFYDRMLLFIGILFDQFWDMEKSFSTNIFIISRLF